MRPPAAVGPHSLASAQGNKAGNKRRVGRREGVEFQEREKKDLKESWMRKEEGK